MSVKIDGSLFPPVNDYHLEQLGFEMIGREDVNERVFYNLYGNEKGDHILDFGGGEFIIEQEGNTKYDGPIQNPVFLSLLLFNLKIINEDIFEKEPLMI